MRTFALLALLAAVGCDHRPEDYGRVRAASESFADNASRRIGELEARHGALRQRASALPAESPGLADVLSRLNAVEAQLADTRTQLAATREAVSAKVAEKRRRLAEEALGRGEQDLRARLDEHTRALDEVGAALERIDGQRAADAAAAAAPPAPTSIDDPIFARQPGTADLAGVVFRPATATLDLRASKPALDRLRAFADTCPELRFGITGHTARDGDANLNARLSGAQAEAVRQFLVRAGVPAERIARVDGVGGERPLVAEPAAGSAEERAMATDELAAIRAQNRRLSITVLTPCPS